MQREPESLTVSVSADADHADDVVPCADAFARAPRPGAVSGALPGPDAPPAREVADDDRGARPPTDGDDDDVAATSPERAARLDPRLLDPDGIERARRVEIYRRLMEQDPQRSMFARPESPPRRELPAPRGL